MKYTSNVKLQLAFRPPQAPVPLLQNLALKTHSIYPSLSTNDYSNELVALVEESYPGLYGFLYRLHAKIKQRLFPLSSHPFPTHFFWRGQNCLQSNF